MSFVRIFAGVTALVALSACEVEVPDSGYGVSDATLADARAVREAELSGLAAAQAPAPTPEVVTLPSAAGQTVQLDSPTPVVIGASPAAVDPYAGPTGFTAATPTIAPAQPVIAPAQPVITPAQPPAPVVATAPRAATGISDEQSFAAVSARETIESDANRLAQNAAQYEVVQPTALPTRPASSGPNIVDYAMSTSNPIGNRIYRRVGFNAQAKYDRNCRSYANPSLAQLDFLARGGPKRDRRGLDPDGDGYACSWDPAPFRIGALPSQ